jgi:hypothetical protein
VVVEDSRDDDNYITSLKRAFERNTKATAEHQPETYTSPADIGTTGNTSNVFQELVQNICETDATTIYFAGRFTQLRQFVNELGTRGCKTKSYTVLTGSEANSLLSDGDLDTSALTNGVTLRYVSLAHPAMWSGAPPTGGSTADLAQLTSLVDEAKTAPIGPIGPTDLNDSRTIVMHDTVWTAITGIRNSAAGKDPVPTLGDVAASWQLLHSAHTVKGAGGWICLDKYGNPYDKALAMVEMQPDRTVRFVGLAWPTGAPPTADCAAPNGS